MSYKLRLNNLILRNRERVYFDEDFNNATSSRATRVTFGVYFRQKIMAKSFYDLIANDCIIYSYITVNNRRKLR